MPVRSYVQVFRNGCVEAVTTEIFCSEDGQHFIYPSYEGRVEQGLYNYLSLLQGLGIEPPIFVSLAFVGAQDYSLALPGFLSRLELTEPIAREVLIIPETPIYDHDALRESFDRVWQTCGRFGSINYTDGKWSAEISRD